MGKGVELFFNSGNDFGMAMAGIQHRNAGGEVDILVAFYVPHRGIFGFIGIEITHDADTARRRLQTPVVQFVIFHPVPLRKSPA